MSGGRIERAITVEDAKNLGVSDAVEGTLFDHSFNHSPFFCCAMLQRMNRSHRNLAFSQIAGHRLSQDLFRGGEVKHVIHNLECHAKIASIAPDLVFLLGSCAAEYGHQPHADRKQAGGLAIDQVKVLVERDELAEFLHLQEFAFNHLLREFDQRVENTKVALQDRNLEGLHVEPVAGQHAFRVSPLGVGGGTSAPCLGFVNDVVVDKGGGVDNFNDCAEFDRSSAFIIEKLGREQEKGWADALASTATKVFADLSDGSDAGNGVAAELALDGG